MAIVQGPIDGNRGFGVRLVFLANIVRASTASIITSLLVPLCRYTKFPGSRSHKGGLKELDCIEVV